jgi:hypothetical protein
MIRIHSCFVLFERSGSASEGWYVFGRKEKSGESRSGAPGSFSTPRLVVHGKRYGGAMLRNKAARSELSKEPFESSQQQKPPHFGVDPCGDITRCFLLTCCVKGAECTAPSRNLIPFLDMPINNVVVTVVGSTEEPGDHFFVLSPEGQSDEQVLVAHAKRTGRAL